MKKILYLIGVVLFAASCTDKYEEWTGTPITNDEEEAKAVKFTPGQAEPIDFANIENPTEETVQLFVPTVAVPDEYSVNYVVKIYNEDMTDSREITVDEQGNANAEEVRAAIVELYGKKPVAHNVPMNIKAYVMVNGQNILAATSSDEAPTVSITLSAPFISEGYYLIGNMTTNGWDNISEDYKFTHIGDGSVYDSPTFEITFETTADNQYWKIIPQSNVDAGTVWYEGETGVLGTAVDGDDSFEGSLVTSSPQAGKIATAGKYKMTLNMEEYTYTIQEIKYGLYFYEIGNESGWGTAHPLLSGLNSDQTPNGIYVGWYHLDGAFKFKPNEDNWNDDIGQNPSGAYGTLIQDGEEDCNKSDGAFPDEVRPAGFYRITLNLPEMTYALLPVNVSIIGDATAGGWNSDTPMEWNNNVKCWEINQVELKDGEFKFRGNGNWDDFNFGGNPNEPLVWSGANIAVSAGIYNIRLYEGYAGSIRCTITKLMM